jgi:hypothetical protein
LRKRKEITSPEEVKERKKSMYQEIDSPMCLLEGKKEREEEVGRWWPITPSQASSVARPYTSTGFFVVQP